MVHKGLPLLPDTTNTTQTHLSNDIVYVVRPPPTASSPSDIYTPPNPHIPFRRHGRRVKVTLRFLQRIFKQKLKKFFFCSLSTDL